jgi:hypothetical protein
MSVDVRAVTNVFSLRGVARSARSDLDPSTSPPWVGSVATLHPGSILVPNHAHEGHAVVPTSSRSVHSPARAQRAPGARR